ncbi:MAG: hypothetical protein PHI85_06490 [Victivallaceae bacterium]|nr:hypothetical protein [Victivallaceae bacterium]
MSFLIPNEFAGLSVGRSTVSAVTLKRVGGKLRILNRFSAPADKEDAIKRAAARVVTSADTVLAVTAAVPGAIVFHCATLDITLERQREALEFELPRHLAATSTAMRFGHTFTPDGKGGGTAVVLAAPAAALSTLCATLENAGIKADALLNPIQAMPPECDGQALFLPDFDPDYYWLNGGYERAGADTAANVLNSTVAAELAKRIDAPAEDILEYIAPILAADFAARPEFSRRAKPLLPLLPPRLRTGRCRIWAKTAMILAALLALNYGFAGLRAAFRNHAAYQTVESELDTLTGKFNALKKSVSARERNVKEMQKALDGSAAAENPAADWALLATVLPEGTTLNYIRWNGGAIQLSLQTSSEEDIPRLLTNARHNTKVTVNSQGARGDSRSMELTIADTGGGK